MAIQDIKENQMNTGSPSYLRGIGSNGNSIIVSKEQALSFFNIYKIEATLQVGEEYDLGKLSYGMYILSCGAIGGCALFLAGSYKYGYIGECGINKGSQRFGELESGAEICFGRKETNGNLFLKNNRKYESKVVILAFYTTT